MQILKIKKAILQEVFADEPSFRELCKLWDAEVPLTIDSRFVPPQSIFFALKGDINDGHNFIQDALLLGAILVIASASKREELKIASIPVIFVEDTLECFSHLAHRHLMSMKALRIGITGSNGKTTVKEMTKAALSAVLGEDLVYANRGTFNNHFGVPISALEVQPRDKVAIFELGMNHAGEISELCQIVKPELALITNIDVAHAGNFVDGINGVQAAKGELFAAIANIGRAIINIDNERVKEEANKHQFLSSTTFGQASSADVHLIDRTFSTTDGSQKLIVGLNGSQHSFSIPLAGLHNALNAVAALAVVKELGLDIEKAALGISDMILNAGRLNIAKALGCTVINDGYNANPISMKAGILACLELEANRRIAVIGAMGELGDESDAYHFEMGTILATHFEAIFACGLLVKPLLKGASTKGLADDMLFYRDSSEELVGLLQAFIKPGDLIFIKGSKSARMQLVAEALSGNS